LDRRDIAAPFGRDPGWSCKAYDLDSAIDAIAPAAGPGSTILPVLNGMRHLEVLDARFGRSAFLGGQAPPMHYRCDAETSAAPFRPQ
jgi:ketopantoate reductase